MTSTLPLSNQWTEAIGLFNASVLMLSTLPIGCPAIIKRTLSPRLKLCCMFTPSRVKMYVVGTDVDRSGSPRRNPV